MSDRPEIIVLEDAAAVAEAAARCVIEAARGNAHLALALAGGSTPKAAYARLAGAHIDDVDWSRVSLFFGDERCVPPEHADSNFRMAKEALLDPLAAHGKTLRSIARIEGELAPAEAARRYIEKLAALPQEGGAPVLGLALLGMGPDGHTASLFPGSTALEELRDPVAATYVERLGVHRVTLTYPCLAAARHIVVLVTGAEKAEALSLALDGPVGAVPLRDLRPTVSTAGRGRMTILCDRAASAKLE